MNCTLCLLNTNNRKKYGIKKYLTKLSTISFFTFYCLTSIKVFKRLREWGKKRKKWCNINHLYVRWLSVQCVSACWFSLIKKNFDLFGSLLIKMIFLQASVLPCSRTLFIRRCCFIWVTVNPYSIPICNIKRTFGQLNSHWQNWNMSRLLFSIHLIIIYLFLFAVMTDH